MARQEMDITYKCDRCDEEFTREEARSDKVQVGTERVNITDFVKDEIGAKVEIGMHKGCGGKVFIIAGKNL